MVDYIENGKLYETELATKDKVQKKAKGQYYTPIDVAKVMVKWFHSPECKGENICDVGCGTGNLILTYLDYIGYENAVDLIKKGRVYLYDVDETALKMCKKSILAKYNIENSDCIHDVCGDFLSDDVKLPDHAKVISNPPYAGTWGAFMKKIFANSESCVIITPFTFISGAKFADLRKQMCDTGGGFIVSFDNVPGNIFCGKKQGVFNTNKANSVRPAITVFRKGTELGFRVSPLIRFKNEERSGVLVNEVLENLLPETLQKHGPFKKLNKELEKVFNAWETKSKYKVKDVISKEKTEYFIDMPNTCRYFTSGSHRKLNRGGSIELYVTDKRAFEFLYCMVNSSFAYWWWRIYDGGITYPKSLLLEMPLPLNLLGDDDFFSRICREMIAVEEDCVVRKLNAGKLQENIKFPQKYRDCINNKIVSILGFEVFSLELDFLEFLDFLDFLDFLVHGNRFFE